MAEIIYYKPFRLHTQRMLLRGGPFISESTKVIYVPPQPANNPQLPYPYFMEKLRRYQIPYVTDPITPTPYIPKIPVATPESSEDPQAVYKMMLRQQRPWVTEVESPYVGWPRSCLEQGIMV